MIFLCKFAISSAASQHKSPPSTHTGQPVHAVYVCSISVWAGYFRTLQLLSNQTANEGGRGGSHQEQTACPLSFNPICSLSSCLLRQTPFTTLAQLSSRRIRQPRFWNTKWYGKRNGSGNLGFWEVTSSSCQGHHTRPPRKEKNPDSTCACMHDHLGGRCRTLRVRSKEENVTMWLMWH